MFKRYAKTWLAVCLAGSSTMCAQTPRSQLAFSRAAQLKHGINTSIWFAQSPGNYGVDRLRVFTTEQDIDLIAKLGFDHIRLSIDAVPLTAWKNGDDAGKAFMGELDRVIDKALSDKLAVIVDIHPEDSYKQRLLQGDTEVAAFNELWRAVATHYASKDPDKIFFELLNEPEQNDPSRWQGIESGLADTVRSVDKVHTLIATGAHYSGLEDLLALDPISDPNVIYTFHDYEPFAFTHQGATWSMSEVKVLRSVPYPANTKDIEPNLAQESTLSAKLFVEKYALDHWDAKRVEAYISFAEQWSKVHDAPVYCGEFGVLRVYADPKARQRWVRETRVAMERHGIGWAMWDYQTDYFGLVVKKDGKTEVDKGLAKALGLKKQ